MIPPLAGQTLTIRRQQSVTLSLANRIPANRLSPAGLALLKVYSEPNTQGGQNWIAAPTAPTDTRQDLIRGNVDLTGKMNVMVRWINESWQSRCQFWADSGFPTVDSEWAQPSKSFAIKLTNTLSSSSVNDFQFSRSGNNISARRIRQARRSMKRSSQSFPQFFRIQKALRFLLSLSRMTMHLYSTARHEQ